MNRKPKPNADPDKAVWCAVCYVRIAPYDLRTVFRNKDYHRHCFEEMLRRQLGSKRVETKPSR